MPVYDGNQAAQEHLLAIAKQCIQAALSAPQFTGRLKIKAEIITGEELIPLVKIYGELAKSKSMVPSLCYRFYKALYDRGEMPLMVLFGSDISQSPGLEWNCGACGYKTCLEFDKNSRENQGSGGLTMGPSCNWMALDFGIAMDWACAAAYQYNIPTRIELLGGLIFRLLGYMPDATCMESLPLGPCRDVPYLVRFGGEFGYTEEEWKDFAVNVGVGLFQVFSGFQPHVKVSNKWWEKPHRYIRVVEDPEFDKLKMEIGKRMLEISKEYRDKKALSESKALTKE